MPPAVAEPEGAERVVKELPALMDGSAADTDTPDTAVQEVHKPKHVVGIIYPPPEVRNIVDKTASFVARNGPEFESRIRQNELNNPKFNFLNGGDPYHAYYQHRVEEIREGKAEPVGGAIKPLVPLQLTPQTAPGGGAVPGGPPAVPAAGTGQVRAGQEMFRPAAERQMVVTEPPPEYEFTADPPSISSVDLDTVKLTAQFVARNGRQFLTNLMNREQRNYQFDFLRPQHSLFQYFTKLLEQYTKVLIPPKDLMAKLELEADSPAQVLDRVRYRVEWDRLQEARKRREEEAVERERVSYAQIDWHDFVVVETVDYQPWEQGQFPPPTNPTQVGQRVLMQERIDDGEEMQMSDEEPEPEPEPEESSSSSSEEEEEEEEEQEPAAAAAGRAEPERGVQDNTQVQDMEEDSDEETEEPRRQPPPPPSLSRAQPPAPPPPPMPPKPDQVVIKKYDPKAAAKPSRAPAPDEYLISPITGERIPASQVAEHMRIGLLDPRWVEQRDRQLNEKVNQETVYATGGDIGSHLQNLAERRTDIFGAGDEETIIGKKIGEEEKRADDKSIWDGHSSSVESTRSAARASVTLDQQISHINKAKSLMEETERIGPKKTGGRGGERDRDRRDRRDRDERDLRDRDERQPQPPPPPPLPPTPKAPAPPPPPAPAPAPPPPPREAPKPPPPAPPAPRITPQPPQPPKPPQPPQPPQLPQPPQPPQLPQPAQPLLLRPPLQMTPQMGPQGVMMAPRPPVVLPARPMFMQAMPAGFMPQMQPGPPRPPMQMPAPEPIPADDEPPNKRARTEDSLVPEHHWLARHPQGTVTFCVAVPTVTDKPEWRLSGQTLTLTMPLTDMVSVVKARLHDETGLPPGKQKLLGEGIFFKDSNTLAYYNVANGSTVQLQLKERGGRKK